MGRIAEAVHGMPSGSPGRFWHVPPSPLSVDDVRALTAQGLRSDEIALLRGVPFVHVVETALLGGILLNPGRPGPGRR